MCSFLRAATFAAAVSGAAAHVPECPAGCPKVAIVGAGVSTASFIYDLREELAAKKLCVTVFETGSTAGGRAASFYVEGTQPRGARRGEVLCRVGSGEL